MTNCKQPLLSLITPCYNGEKYLLPYIQGLLSQTWQNVEFIFVNDASIDKTEELILSYKGQFEAKGWKFIYLKQDENKGAARAINQGLKIFNGKYISWFDSDDVMSPQFFEKSIAYLEEHEDVGVVFPSYEIINAETKKKISAKVLKPIQISNALENELIWGGEESSLPSFAVARSAFLLDVLKGRHIYDERKSGQNAALLFPLFNKYKVGYLSEILAQYMWHQDSDSHSMIDADQKLLDWELNEINVIQSLDMPEYKKFFYLNKIQENYSDIRKEKLYGGGESDVKINFLGLPLFTLKRTKHKALLKFLGMRIGKAEK